MTSNDTNTNPEVIWATSYYNMNRSEHVRAWSPSGFDGLQQDRYVRSDLASKWQLVGECTPRETEMLLGWRDREGRWETCMGYYSDASGCWVHALATHWAAIPAPPTEDMV